MSKSLTVKGNRSSCQARFEDLQWDHTQTYEIQNVTVGVQSNSAPLLQSMHKKLAACKPRHVSVVDLAYSLHEDEEHNGVALYFSWSALAPERLSQEAAVALAFDHLQRMLCWRSTKFLGLPAHLLKTADGIQLCWGPELPNDAHSLGKVLIQSQVAFSPSGKCRGVLNNAKLWSPTEIRYFGAPDGMTAHLNEYTRPLAFVEKHPKDYLGLAGMLLRGRLPTGAGRIPIYTENV